MTTLKAHWLLFALPLLLLGMQLGGYFMGETGIWLGWLLLYMLSKDADSESRAPLQAAAFRLNLGEALGLFLMLIVLLLPVRTLLFLAGFSLWAGAMARAGRPIGYLGWCMGLAMSPVYFVGSQLFTFPIRLALTDWAGKILRLMGHAVQTQGNTLIGPDQQVFTVEPACEGLALLQTATLVLIFLLARAQLKNGLRLPLRTQAFLLALGLVAAFAANLMRMVLLVWFHAPPETLAHELIGLMSLFFYVCLPAHFLFQAVAKRYGAPSPARYLPQASHALQVALLLLFVAQCFFFRQNAERDAPFALNEKDVQTFDCQVLKGNILQCQKAGALLYVKPIPHFYSSEHHPALCWQGSGFTLSSVRTDTLAGQEVYAGVLSGPSSIMHTAWWYDNGQMRTISQWQWRTAQMRGAAPFSIVNISTSAPENLALEIQLILNSRPVLTK